MTKPKRLPKILKERYSNSSGDYGHNLADLVFEKRFEVKRVKREGKYKNNG